MRCIIIEAKDLASFYEVKPIRLREQVKRNPNRFPSDFVFQLHDVEVDLMVSQNAIPSRQSLGGFLPYVFVADVKKKATVQIEAGRKVTRDIDYYYIDAILPVGYRVNSKQGTQFRTWATNVLHDYLLKGYVLNQKMNLVWN